MTYSAIDRQFRELARAAKGYAIVRFLANQGLEAQFTPVMTFGPDSDEELGNDSRIDIYVDSLVASETQLKEEALRNWLLNGWIKRLPKVESQTFNGQFSPDRLTHQNGSTLSPELREIKLNAQFGKSTVSDINKVLLACEVLRQTLQEGAPLRTGQIRSILLARDLKNVAQGVSTHVLDMLGRPDSPELERTHEQLPKKEISVRITSHGYNKIAELLS